MKRIMICDDEEGIRESLKLILKDTAEYELDFKTSALDAIDAIKQQAPDLLLLDIKMPKLDGIEALKQIKAGNPDLPIMMVTGYDSMETAKAAIDAGAVDYIVKPFESERVKSAVKSALK